MFYKKVIVFIVLLIGIGFAVAAKETQPINTQNAFIFSPSLQKQQLILHWQIAKGFQLYRNKFKVRVLTPNTIALADFNLPRGIKKHDLILGTYQVYEDAVTLHIPLLNVKPSESQILVEYQGCSTSGFCYPPQLKKLTLQISVFGAVIQNIENIALPATTSKTNYPTHKNYGLLLLTFYFLGLLLAFTPCVLPMIPILSAIIIGRTRSLGQAFALSLIYVLAMALAYAAAGLLAGLAGSHLQAALQTPAVIIIFAIVFTVLALSLFGVYDLRLPSSWENKFNQLSQKQKSGSYIGVAIMGALSVLIVSPCLSAPLVAALAYISQSQNTLSGALILFCMGLGMGTPLIIIGTFGQRLIPKTGLWMQKVKVIFGILLLVTAVWLLYRILPGNICLIIWGVIAIVSAIYLGIFGFNKLNRRTLIWFFLGWLWFLLGITYVIGGILNNQDPMHPLHSQKSTALQFIKIKNVSELQQALHKARGKPVLLDFYADWCVSCKLMEQNIFAQSDVQNALQSFVLLRADITANDSDDKALQKYLHVYAPPTLIFFNRDGQEIAGGRIFGEVSKQMFLQRVKNI